MIEWKFLESLSAKPMINLDHARKIIDAAFHQVLGDVNPKNRAFIYVDFVDSFDYDKEGFRTRGETKFNKFTNVFNETGSYVIVTFNTALSWEVLCVTAFHEMVHVKQHLEGRLEHSGLPGYIIWEGLLHPHTLSYDSFKEYQELPWEVEARTYEGDAKKMVKRHLGIFGYLTMRTDMFLENQGLVK